jgi:hypothetical protein
VGDVADKPENARTGLRCGGGEPAPIEGADQPRNWRPSGGRGILAYGERGFTYDFEQLGSRVFTDSAIVSMLFVHGTVRVERSTTSMTAGMEVEPGRNGASQYFGRRGGLGSLPDRPNCPIVRRSPSSPSPSADGIEAVPKERCCLPYFLDSPRRGSGASVGDSFS